MGFILGLFCFLLIAGLFIIKPSPPAEPLRHRQIDESNGCEFL